MNAVIQFAKGVDELTIPVVNITRSRDGSTGTATFIFQNPNIFYKILGSENEITGMFLIDTEGTLSTRDITVKFIQGKPKTIQATYIIKNSDSWDRFMRFMERYAAKNNLTFVRA